MLERREKISFHEARISIDIGDSSLSSPELGGSPLEIDEKIMSS